MSISLLRLFSRAHYWVNKYILYTMVTKNGDMMILSWRCQLQASLEILVSIIFKVTENGGAILQEETIVLHRRCSYFEVNSRDGGAESFQDEPCDNDDENDNNVDDKGGGRRIKITK